MDQIPEFDEKKTKETKNQNENTNSGSDNDQQQQNKYTIKLEEPINQAISPLQKNISSPLSNNSQKKTYESPATNVSRMRRRSSKSSRKSVKNIQPCSNSLIEENEIHLETVNLPRRNTITLADSSPENSPLKSEGDTPSQKVRPFFADSQLSQQKKDSIQEKHQIQDFNQGLRKQQFSEHQNLDEEEKDNVPSPKIKISDIANELYNQQKQNIQSGSNGSLDKNLENNVNKIPLVINSNKDIQSNNNQTGKTKTENIPFSMSRMKSTSYSNKEISQQYVDALKKSIVAISYDVENQDQVEDNLFTDLKSPKNNEYLETTPKTDKKNIFIQERLSLQQKTLGDEPNNTPFNNTFKLKKTSTTTNQNQNHQSIQFSFQRKRLNSTSSMHIPSQQSERFAKQNLQKFGIQYKTQRESSENQENKSLSIKNHFESPNCSPLTNGKKIKNNLEDQDKNIINLQKISDFDSENPQIDIKNIDLQIPQQQIDQNQIDQQQNEQQQTNSISNTLIQSQYSSTSIQKKNSMNLFERFFMIGNDKSVLEEVTDDENIKDWIVPAKIMYCYPQDNLKTDPIYSIIHDFAFPFGVEIVKLPQKKSIPKQITEEIIIQGSNPKQMIPKFFYFTIKSEETEQQLYNTEYNDTNVNQVYQTVNPNKILYCVCLRIKDFFETTVPGQNGEPDQRKFWKLNKVYCFVSKFPFYELFQDIICQLINEIKIQRMGQLAQLNINQPGQLQKIDSDWVNSLLDTQIQQYLEKLQQKFEPQFNYMHSFQGVFDNLVYQIPDSQEAYLKMRQWSIVPTFSNLIIEDFLLILFSILMERTVIFVSKSQALLTHSIHTFETLLHPFQWTNPIIYCLPESLLEILDSPVPLIIGINQSEEYINSDSIDTRYPNYIFVYLDSQRIYSSNIQQLIDIEDSIPNFNNFLMKLRMNYNIINVEAANNHNQLTIQHEKQKKKKDGFFNRIFENRSDKKSKSNISPLKSNFRRASYATSDFNSHNLTHRQENSDKKGNHQSTQSQQINLSKQSNQNTQNQQQTQVSNNNLSIYKVNSTKQQKQYPVKFFPQKEELAAADLIMYMVHNTLKFCIIDIIPQQIKYTEDNLIDFDQLIKEMLTTAQEDDKQFLQIFGKTQIFTYYVETHAKKQLY